MPQKYVLSPTAEGDLEDIWTYTAREWSVEQAETYTNDIINMFEDIAAGKRDGRPVLVRAGYLKALVGRHAIYFQARDEVIAIIRILHQSMDVERHLLTKGMSASAGRTAETGKSGQRQQWAVVEGSSTA